MLVSGATTSFQQISEIRRKLGIGPPGAWVPAGGATNTVLTKLSAADYDTGWVALLGGLITAGNGIVFVGNTVHFAQAAAYTAGAIPFATGVATMGFDAANLFWDDGNNRLGIGTNAPTGRLEVLETRSDALAYVMDHQVLTTTVSGGTKRAFASQVATSGAANFAAGLLSGGLSSSYHGGAGNVTGNPRMISHEMYHGKGATGTGNMDASIGLYVQSLNLNAVGALAATYDIYIPTPITTGPITANYPIYQVNPAGINYFGGLVNLNLMTPGSVLFTGAAGRVSQDNANLFWDDTLNRLGIGIAVPLYQLHVAGTTYFSGASLFGSTVTLFQDPVLAMEAATMQYVQSYAAVAGNGIVLAGLGTIHFAQAAAYTAGAIPFATGVATMGFDAANLFWDDGNNRLGIGTATLTSQLTTYLSAAGAVVDSLGIDNPAGGAGWGTKISYKHATVEVGKIQFYYPDATNSYSMVLGPLGAGGVPALFINYAGKIGINIYTPTAFLHLPQCQDVLNRASLKITPGTLATGANIQSGNIESDGTHLYWTDSGAIRRQLDGLCTLTGAVDPNGVVTGILGQIYTEIPGDGSAALWINTDGATTWV